MSLSLSLVLVAGCGSNSNNKQNVSNDENGKTKTYKGPRTQSGLQEFTKDM